MGKVGGGGFDRVIEKFSVEKNELSQKINRQINSPLSELGRGHLGLTAFKRVRQGLLRADSFQKSQAGAT